jgi:predicted kinase
MEVLMRAGVPMEPSSDRGIKGIGDIGYDLQTALLREQLQMGHSVVLDCGAERHLRESWRRVADEAGANFWLVGTVCSDVDLHRRRFEERGRTWSGETELTWATVEDSRTRFLPDPRAAFVADATRSVEENVRSIVALVRGA